MQEELISFETAKLAKEKGLDLKTKYLYSDYSENKCLVKEKTLKNWNDSIKYTSAITQSLLQKWLREVHQLHIMCYLLNGKYWCNIRNIKNEDSVLFISNDNYNTYEEALEAGLQEALKLIK